jgi:RHS repeat-associated protein
VDDQLANTGDSGWYTIQIVAPNTNAAPTASISGPGSLTAGQNGTWNYSAADSNANLYRWRLVIAGAPQSWSYISGGSASSSLTMSFASAGTYSLAVEVEDASGATGSASTSVTVSSPPATSLPYTVSSSYPAHYSYPSLAANYTYLTDGIHTNNYGYGSDNSLPNWLMADFGSTKRITKVHVGGGFLAGWGWASDYSSGSVLQYSNDASNWTTAHTFSSGFSSTGTSVSLDINARYWRLYRTSWLGTTEFRFEGTAGSTPTYTVNVVNGTTSGQSSATVTEGTTIPIAANAPPANQLFSQWTKTGPGSITNAASPSTSFVVGNGAATLSANYVTNATPTASISAAGSTTILAGATATILYSSTDANANLTQWRVSLLPNSAQWTSISGGSQSAQFNYTFNTAGTYTFKLEVVDSLGATATAQVTFTVQAQVWISPNPVASGQTFGVGYTGSPTTSSWIGVFTATGPDTSPIKSGSVPSAGSGTVYFLADSLLPPGTYNARLFQATGSYVKLGTSATFTVQAAATYSLTVNGGTGSASGLSGNAQVTITATPPSGMVFSQWTRTSSDTGTFGNVNASTTTYTLNNANAAVRAEFSTVLDPNADNDSDGLPNGWENSYGLNPNSALDALLDPDSDGMNNLAEYNLGTSPLAYNAGTAESGTLSKPAGWPLANLGNAHVVGATSGQANVDSSGAFTYSIPIWTTPGSAGMEPTVALNYSSQGGNGIAGLGWSLSGIPAITRGPQTKPIDGINRGVTLTASDRFYMDGQRLLVVSGVYGVAGSEYRTELDSISRIVANGSAGTGPASFTVHTKAGLILQFGQTPDSARDAMMSGNGEAGPVPRAEKISWHVNRITDTKGSFMTFEYEEDVVNGTHRLVRINYTGNGGVAPYASLRFEYEERTDWSRGYAAGSPLSNAHRLKTIKSYYGEIIARSYTLNYRTNSGTELYTDRSILASLVETGKDGKSYPPLTFEYEHNAYGWIDASQFLPAYYLADNSNYGRPAGSGFIDFDGDGRTDFVARRDGMAINLAKRNTGNGWVDNTNYLLPHPLAFSTSALDTGGRFVDIDGDGLVDYLWWRMGAGGNTHEKGARRNNGSGWEAAPTWWTPPSPIAKDDLPLHGAKFMDVNGDGRVDMVSHIRTGQSGTHNIFVYLNTGSSWQYDAGYSTIGQDIAQWKGRFIDLNGDGLVDIATNYHGNDQTMIKTWINTGFGWQDTPAYYLPRLIADNHNYSVGAEFADVNADGLPDLLWYREPGVVDNGVAINTGVGWRITALDTSRYSPPHPLARDGFRSAGGAFLDLNLDGLADVAFSRQFSGGPEEKHTLYGTGRGYYFAGDGAPHDLPHLLLQGGLDQTGADFVDLNSDGAVDALWYRKHPSGGEFSMVRLNQSRAMADRIKSVTNGFGVKVEVAYDSLMNPSVYTKAANNDDLPESDRSKVANLIGPRYVVSSLKNEDGIGGIHELKYSYGVLRSHVDRGSLGFGYMKVHDQRTDIRAHTFYRQDYPFIGMADHTRVTIGSDTSGVLSEAFTDWSVKLLNTSAAYPSRILYASQVEERAYDFSTHQHYLTTTTTTTPPDDFGNVTSITVATSDGFSKTTTSQYLPPDTTAWILGRLSTVTVASSASGQQTRVRKSSFTYDQTSTGGGLLKSETIEPDNDVFKLATTYVYDAWGNKIAVETKGKDLTVSGGTYIVGSDVTRTATTQYDSQGRFPLWTKNALNHTETYTGYDQALGVALSMTGINGLATTWQYDGFGRKLREDRADGTFTQTTYRWPSSGAPLGTVYFVETEVAGGGPAVSFHDKLGRVIETNGVSGDTRLVRQKTLYDGLGRVSAVSRPFYPGSTEYWSTTTYDVMGRPIQVVSPDEANGAQSVAYSYSNLTTAATDPKGRVTETVRNSQGWMISTIRNKLSSGPDTSSVTHTHDALGNLISSSAEGAVTTFVYDERGRKTSMTEPNMGTWAYRYNVFGELIWQQDAKGQVTTMSYDPLGRLVTQVQPASDGFPSRTMTWTYDSASGKGVGKLARVVDTLGYEETFAYDNFGRSIRVDRKIAGAIYTVQTGYDSRSRPNRIIYPATGLTTEPFSVRHVYNDFGYLKEIRGWIDSDSSKQNHQLQGRVFWRTDKFSAAGKVESDIYGNGLANDRIHSEATGRLLHAAIDRAVVIGSSYSVQNLHYAYDKVGNVIERRDDAIGRSEYLYTSGSTNRDDGYDGLDRLLLHRVVDATYGNASVSVGYNRAGSITFKSDVTGNYYDYSSARVHALTYAGGKSYVYDANGSMIQAGGTYTGRHLSWTSFGQIWKIRDISTGKAAIFSFDAGGQRVGQERFGNANASGTPSEVTVYVGSLYEKVGSGTNFEHKHYILAPTGRVAVYTDRTSIVSDTRYLHSDGLGSITAVTDERGRVLRRHTYDPWGKQSIRYTNTAPGVVNAAPTTRGFTDHEGLGDFGLVHMNGRVYDPVLGRFLSADPFVGDASDAQEYNRYSYLTNNPLGGTDPSGFFSLKDVVKIVAVVVAAVVTAGVAVYGAAVLAGQAVTLGNAFAALVGAGGWSLTGYGAIVAGAGAGFASGFAGSLLNGGSIGDAFKTGVIGGIVGGITGGLAHGIGGSDLGYFGRAAAHGVVQGGAAELQGGQFRHGFSAGFVTAAASPAIGAFPRQARIVAAAVVGGTASAIGGGKFANGAVGAAFQYLLNDAQHKAAEKQQVRITKAAIQVNRIGFRDFDAKAAAVVDFVGAWESFPANRFDGLPTTSAVNSFEDAVEFFLGVGQFAGEQAGAIPSPANYKSVTSRALNGLRSTLGRVGPFEARTIIEYQTLEQRPFLVFWSREQWVTHLWVSPVNGPHLGLFLDTKSATDAASKMLVERARGFQSGSK